MPRVHECKPQLIDDLPAQNPTRPRNVKECKKPTLSRPSRNAAKHACVQSYRTHKNTTTTTTTTTKATMMKHRKSATFLSLLAFTILLLAVGEVHGYGAIFSRRGAQPHGPVRVNRAPYYHRTPSARSRASSPASIRGRRSPSGSGGSPAHISRASSASSFTIRGRSSSESSGSSLGSHDHGVGMGRRIRERRSRSGSRFQLPDGYNPIRDYGRRSQSGSGSPTRSNRPRASSRSSSASGSDYYPTNTFAQEELRLENNKKKLHAGKVVPPTPQLKPVRKRRWTKGAATVAVAGTAYATGATIAGRSNKTFVANPLHWVQK